jgi:hypothetical protein
MEERLERFCSVYTFRTTEGFDAGSRPKVRVNEIKIYPTALKKSVEEAIVLELRNYKKIHDFSHAFVNESTGTEFSLKSKIAEFVVSNLEHGENAIVTYDYSFSGGIYSVWGNAFVRRNV